VRIVRDVRAAALALPVTLLLLAGACGGGSDGGPTSLTVVFWEDGQRPEDSVTWELSCDPAAGSHPDPEAACATVASADADVFDPVPGDTACTEIFGGPQRADVSGTVAGETVEATFTRANGCEIERWDALVGLLPAS
jgi:hypothetical protein